MSSFADTNWLEALYFVPGPEDRQAQTRRQIVERRMRKQSGPLFVSPIVLLEARNVFGRVSGEPCPVQWERLVSDFGGPISVDSMNWDVLRQQTHRLFERFSQKTTLGTLDATLVASAQVAGAREILSFDEGLKAVAAAVGLKVFPPLGAQGKTLSAHLRR